MSCFSGTHFTWRLTVHKSFWVPQLLHFPSLPQTCSKGNHHEYVQKAGHFVSLFFRGGVRRQMHSAAWQELELPATESKCYSMFNCSHTNADLLQPLTLSNLSASS